MSQTLPTAGGNQDDQFGAAIYQDGTTLAIGAPATGSTSVVPQVHLYELNSSGERWTLRTSIAGELESEFGAAVALEGDQLVIGIPESYASYHSVVQEIPSYELDLGVADQGASRLHAPPRFSK